VNQWRRGPSHALRGKSRGGRRRRWTAAVAETREPGAPRGGKGGEVELRRPPRAAAKRAASARAGREESAQAGRCSIEFPPDPRRYHGGSTVPNRRGGKQNPAAMMASSINYAARFHRWKGPRDRNGGSATDSLHIHGSARPRQEGDGLSQFGGRSVGLSGAGDTAEGPGEWEKRVERRGNLHVASVCRWRKRLSSTGLESMSGTRDNAFQLGEVGARRFILPSVFLRRPVMKRGRPFPGCIALQNLRPLPTHSQSMTESFLFFSPVGVASPVHPRARTRRCARIRRGSRSL